MVIHSAPPCGLCHKNDEKITFNIVEREGVFGGWVAGIGLGQKLMKVCFL